MSAQGGSPLRSMGRTEFPAWVLFRRIGLSSALAVALMILAGCKETQTLGPLVHQAPSAPPKPLTPALDEDQKAPEVANRPAPIPSEAAQISPGTG